MKRAAFILLSIASAGFLFVIPSCDYAYIDPVEINIPDTVSFSADVLPIFEQECNSAGCHTKGGVPPDLTPQNAYNNLYLYSLVDTAEAKSSVLYQRMSSDSKPMPQNGKLSEDKIQLILAWIEQGARDN